MDCVNDLLRTVPIPYMASVRQHFPTGQLEDPPAVLRRELSRPAISGRIHPGMSIAITAGSRGTDCYVPLLQELVAALQRLGAHPFVIPAMGSHGGATADGQAAMLAGYGITESSIGAPVRSSMEVVQLGVSSTGEPVWADKLACGADGIILFNRVKPHTGFRGDFESGLVKMAAIGLGKQKGAETVHAGGPALMAERVRDFGLTAIQQAKILFGIATVENSYDRVVQLRALTPEEIVTQEPLLLWQAKELLPRLYLEHLDVLIVDRVGKNISGPGMDPNITHTYLPGAAIPDALRRKRAKRVAVLDLTEETHGAAMGIGMADVTTRRLFDKMDPDTTYPNCLTSGVTVSAKLPMVFDSDRLAIQAAIRTIPGADWSCLRIARIRDTLHLGEIWISEALMSEADALSHVEVLAAPAPLPFDAEGNLF